MGDSMEPVDQQFPFADGGRLAEKDKEGGLESVFGIVAIVENPAADTQNHRPMTPDQRFKRCVFSMKQEGFEQLCVCQPIRFLQKGHLPQVTDESAHGRGCHAEYSGAYPSFATNILPGGWRFPTIIFQVSK
jgi:hypothetical protein